jgi:hypothetical protein
MPFQVSPGVNVSEIDLTTIVPAVDTSSAGMAGHFRWGPVDQIVLLSNETELVDTFNKPNANTADDFFTAANFLSYANSLQTVRVVKTGTLQDATLLLLTLLSRTKMITKKIILQASQVLVSSLLSIQANLVTHSKFLLVLVQHSGKQLLLQI